MNTQPEDAKEHGELAIQGLVGLDLNLLTVFDAVMVERHVTRAAERLNLTQSAVSNALGRLRALFGDPLFRKGAQGVVPTAKALELWPVVHHSLQQLEQAIKPSAFEAAHARRSFCLTLSDVFASLFLPRILSRFMHEAPHAILKFVPQDDQLTAVRLVRGEADFEISHIPPRLAAVASVPVWSEPLVMVARKGHPLLVGELTIERLCKNPHVVVNMGGLAEFSMEFDTALTAIGLSRFIKLSVNQFSVAAAALLMSDLVAIMPRHFVLQPLVYDQVAFRAVPLPMGESTFHLSWHRRNEALVSHEWFKTLLLDAIKELKERLAGLEAGGANRAPVPDPGVPTESSRR